MTKPYLYIGIGVVALILIFGGVWFFFFRAPASTNTTSATSFGTATNNSTSVTPNNSSGGVNGSQPVSVAQPTSQQKIFEIAAGPIVGATFIQTLNPTTTLARYIMQEDGHVYDMPLDVPGAVPRVVSNVTIPGGVRALWVEGGNAAILQYLDNTTVKTLYMGFPAATTTGGATLPTKIFFLPDNIEDVTTSPDSKNVAYLLTTPNGSDGYIADANGTAAKKVFSLPLSQVLISWPSQGTLLAQSKSAVGVPGIVFSVDAKSGAVVPLIYAPGLTATANSSFAQIIYQTVAEGASVRVTYAHNVKTGVSVPLSFSPLPEKCIWSAVATSTMYCAAPLVYVPANYLDLWHEGVSSATDAIFSFSLSSNGNTIVAAPGGSDGGSPSDIYQMSLSPDERYLSFTTKGDRSLWGVRLNP